MLSELIVSGLFGYVTGKQRMKLLMSIYLLIGRICEYPSQIRLAVYLVHLLVNGFKMCNMHTESG